MLILNMADATLMTIIVDPIKCSRLRVVASPGLLVCEIDAVAPLRHALDVNGEVSDGETRTLGIVVDGLSVARLRVCSV